MLRQALMAIALGIIGIGAAAAYEAQPRREVSLEGSWVVNAAASDDVDKVVSTLIDKEEKQRRLWHRQMEVEDPFSDPGPVPRPLDAAQRRAEAHRWQRVLGITRTLKVRQQGTHVEIVTDENARRFEAGSSGQVSMPDGNLADLRVGWDGEWFVIDRKVPRGAHVLEKLRRIERTDQLEYAIKWSGDAELSGVKLRFVFDRSTRDEMPPNPAAGPVP